MSTIESTQKQLGFSDIRQWLRHKHPMIFLDRIVAYELGQSIVGLLAISGNMDCIDGHFPGKAIFPGTHLQQSFCQAAIILFQMSTSRLTEHEVTMIGSMNSRFYKAAVPGDIVHIEITANSLRESTFIFSGVASVEGEKIATIQSSMVRKKLNEVGPLLC